MYKRQGQTRVEQRQTCLAARLNVESAEEKEARLQQIRDRLAAESAGEIGQATADARQTTELPSQL